ITSYKFFICPPPPYQSNRFRCIFPVHAYRELPLVSHPLSGSRRLKSESPLCKRPKNGHNSLPQSQFDNLPSKRRHPVRSTDQFLPVLCTQLLKQSAPAASCKQLRADPNCR